jgi:hypothetical protein
LRDFLTVLAILVILVLVTALAGPFFLDWQARRGDVEAALSEALGTPVRTGGAIAVRLLPSPALQLDQVDLGGSGQEPGLTAGRLSVELAVAPLLKGELRVVEASLQNPVLTVLAGSDGALKLPHVRLPGRSVAPVAIEKLTISDGTVRLVDMARGREQAVDGIDVVMQGAALKGPWRVEGRVGAKPLRLSTGELDAAGSMRVKAILGDEASGRIEADGNATLPVAAGGDIVPRFAGKVTYTATLLPAAGNRAAVTLTAAAGIVTQGRSLTTDNLDIEAGEIGRAIKVSGSGRLDFGDRPSAELVLSAKRIDVDEAAESFAPLAQGLPPAAATWQARLLDLPWPVTLKLSMASLAHAGEEMSNVEAGLRVVGGRLAIERFSARLAGDTSVAFSGAPNATAASGGLSGHVAINVPAPPRLALSLARAGLAASRAEALAKLPDFALEADMVASAHLVAARNLRLTAGAASLTGVVRYAPPEGSGRGRLDAQIAAEGLDLATLPDQGDIGPILGGMDLGLTLDARRVRLGEGADAGRLGVRIAVGADGIAVDALDIADLAGATIRAAGRIGAGGDGRIDGTIEAAEAAPVLTLMDKLGLAGGLQGRLPYGFHDAPLRLSLAATAAGAGPLRRLQLNVEGTAAELKLKAAMTFGGLRSDTLARLALTLEAPEASAVLRRLGLDLVTDAATGLAPALGPLRAAVSLAPHDGVSRRLEISGAVAGVTLKTDAPVLIHNDGAASTVPARLTLVSADAAPLARLGGLLVEEGRKLPLSMAMNVTRRQEDWRVGLDGKAGDEPIKGELAVTAEGRITDGTLRTERASLPLLASLLALGPVPPARPGSPWPGAHFADVPDLPLAGAVTLLSHSLDLGNGFVAADARLRLEPVTDGVTLTLDKAAFAGGSIAGSLTLKRLGGNASLAGEVTLGGGRIEALAPGGNLSGQAWLDLRFGGAGQSVGAIVANLAGGGRLRASDVRLKRFDDKGMHRVAQEASVDPAGLDARRLGARLAETLDGGTFVAGPVDVPVTLAGGVLRLSPIIVAAPGAAWQGSVAVDLKSLTLDASGLMLSHTSPAGWTGSPPQAAVTWRGPLLAPHRDIEPSSLANGLAAVQLTRELERVEAFEADARERAAQNRRLKAERDQRAAEARAAEEAKRVEETRRIDDARRLEDEIRQRVEADKLRLLFESVSPQPARGPQAPQLSAPEKVPADQAPVLPRTP